MPSRHWWYFGGFVLTVIALVGVALMALVDAASVLSSGVFYNEEFVLLAMLGEAAEWVAIGIVVALLSVVFLLASVVSVLRNTSIHRDDRLAGLVERLEREYPVLRKFDAAEKVEPTTEDRKEQLTQQYVDGEISEAEFEREMERLLDDDQSESRSHTNVDLEK